MQDLLPLERAAEAAASAAALLLQRRPERVDHKGAIDLVTEVDLASEARIRELLGASTPDSPVQGEEAGGIVSRVDGSTHRPGAPEIVATNGWLHEQVLAMLNQRTA